MLLTNSPTMVSTPPSTSGRPDTVIPNTTSLRSVYTESTVAQASWITVFSVTRRPRAASDSAVVAAASSRISARPGSPGRGSVSVSAGVSRVGSVMPARCLRHSARLASWSRAASQPM